MDLSIIIVSYKQFDFLKSCIDSIHKFCGGISFEVIVVDNCSDDIEINNFLRIKEKELNNFIFIESKTNQGFPKGNNIGFGIARGDFIAFLNPDTVLLNNSFKILIDFMNSNSNAGICGPRILNPDSSFQVSFNTFPSLSKIFIRTLGINKIIKNQKSFLKFLLKLKKLMPGYISLYNSNFSLIDDPLMVPWITGACMVISCNLFKKVGMFDSNYKLYCEDMDLCLQVKKAGFNIFLVPEAKIIHFGGWARRDKNVTNYHYMSYRYYYIKNFTGIYRVLLLTLNKIEWNWEKFQSNLKFKSRSKK